MRRLTVRRQDDDGAVALIVAIVLGGGVLLGAAALSVDVGRIYAERRVVQSGADSATLALAHDCAAGGVCDTSTTGVSRTMANSNASDAATQVILVCGLGPGLAACPAQTGPELGKCPNVPAAITNWLRVTTATAQSNGSTLLPSVFAQSLAGGPTGKTVHACAQAAWGTPGGMATLPYTISECEWKLATAGGYTHLPPYTAADAAQEKILMFHSPDTAKAADLCPAGSGGAYADLPGGFGALDDVGCQVTTSVTGWAGATTGIPKSSCVVGPPSLWKTLAYLPVFDDSEGSGSGGKYHISGYAAFYITGWHLAASGAKQDSSITGKEPCKGSDKCISGFFTKGLVPASGTIGTGINMGASVLALIG